MGVTRLVEASSLSRVSGAKVHLKLESEAPTGSFKLRGAFVAVRAQLENGAVAGVVTSSTGNHGAAVAYAARLLGIPAAIFLPEKPNPVKRERIALLGARIFEAGRDLEESRQRAAGYARERGWHVITDGADPEIALGAATIGCEILEQLPEAEVIYVPVGDSSLIRGVAFAAKHLRPQVRVIGVQAEGAPAYYRAWKERRAIEIPSAETCADGIATRSAPEENVRELCELVDEMQVVSDADLLRAVYRLLLDEHVVAEPAGAAATAAFLASGQRHAGGTVVLLVTGANISAELMRRAVEIASTASPASNF